MANASESQLLLDTHKPDFLFRKNYNPFQPPTPSQTLLRKHKAAISRHSGVHTCTCVPPFPLPLLPPPTPCLCCWEPVISAILLSICSSRSNIDILNWLSRLEKARIRVFPWKESPGCASLLQEATNSYPGSHTGDLFCLATHRDTCPAVS